MGSQEPSARIAPRYKTSDGPDAEALLAVVGLILDPWQSGVLCDWMGRDAAGRWAASSCGGSVPRQNGKTLVLQGRAIAGMVLLNENVVYTSHLQKTSTETFSEMRDIFEHPKLKPYVKDIRNALGREEIILKSGARIKFLARTRNGGRGQHGDLLIFDEAQELDETAQESFLPAISASRNPQTIYIGTPPGPDVTGTVFRNFRERALQKSSRRIAWFEYSVQEIGDVKDPKRWAKTNPALGRRMLLSTIEGEAEQMAPDSFARERLGWWSPKPTEHAEYILIGPLRQRRAEAGRQDRLRRQVRRRRQRGLPVRRGAAQRRAGAYLADRAAARRAWNRLAGRLAQRTIRQGELRCHRRARRRRRAGGPHPRRMEGQNRGSAPVGAGRGGGGRPADQHHQRGRPDLVQAAAGIARERRGRHKTTHWRRLWLWRRQQPAR